MLNRIVLTVARRLLPNLAYAGAEDWCGRGARDRQVVVCDFQPGNTRRISAAPKVFTTDRAVPQGMRN